MVILSCYNHNVHLGLLPSANDYGDQSYEYCALQSVQLNTSMPPIHTVSYRGPLTTTIKLYFVAILSVFEEIFVNESTDIKHIPGTFQRNIVIDANVERLEEFACLIILIQRLMVSLIITLFVLVYKKVISSRTQTQLSFGKPRTFQYAQTIL